jgi:hypothetical protein
MVMLLLRFTDNMFLFINRDFKYSTIEPRDVTKISEEKKFSFRRNRRLQEEEEENNTVVVNENVLKKEELAVNLQAKQRNQYQKQTKISYLRKQKQILKVLFEKLFENINHKFIQAIQEITYQLESFTLSVSVKVIGQVMGNPILFLGLKYPVYLPRDLLNDITGNDMRYKNYQNPDLGYRNIPMYQAIQPESLITIRVVSWTDNPYELERNKWDESVSDFTSIDLYGPNGYRLENIKNLRGFIEFRIGQKDLKKFDLPGAQIRCKYWNHDKKKVTYSRHTESVPVTQITHNIYGFRSQLDYEEIIRYFNFTPTINQRTKYIKRERQKEISTISPGFDDDNCGTILLSNQTICRCNHLTEFSLTASFGGVSASTIGVWRDNYITLDLKVSRPIYKTIGFITVMLTFFVHLLLAAYSYIEYNLVKLRKIVVIEYAKYLIVMIRDKKLFNYQMKSDFEDEIAKFDEQRRAHMEKIFQDDQNSNSGKSLGGPATVVKPQGQQKGKKKDELKDLLTGKSGKGDQTGTHTGDKSPHRPVSIKKNGLDKLTGKIVIATGKKNVDYMDDSLMGMQDVEYHKHFEKNKPGGNNASNYVNKNYF